MLSLRTMVNSHTDEAMVERIERIEKKLDDLATSVERRFDAVGAEFNAVAGAFAEQRQYTEFAFGRLEAKVDAGFARVDSNFARVDANFARVDANFAKVDSRFNRLERKLDDFIKKQGEANEAQQRANELMERRLNRLE